MTHSSLPVNRSAVAADFLRRLFGSCPPELCIHIWQSQGKKSTWLPVEVLGQAESKLHKLCAQSAGNAYVGVALSPEDYGQGKRCPAKQTAGIAGLWVDIDLKGPAHKSKRLPETLDQALELASCKGLPPSEIVMSGHGINVWWLFDSPWIFGGDEDLARAADLSRRWQAAIRRHAQNQGWSLDSTHDLARVLRLPGTWNVKTEPAVEVLVHESIDARYSVGDFLALLADPEPTPSRNGKPFTVHARGASVIDRARGYIDRMPPAISGHRGHDATWAVAQVLVRGFALAIEQARPLLHEYNGRCEPPWSNRELEHKLWQAANASRLPNGYLLNGHKGDNHRGEERFSDPAGNGHPSSAPPPCPESWEPPVPLGQETHGPTFPVGTLTPFLRRWVEAISTETQTPVDLPGMLALVVSGAGLAKRVRVQVRQGWAEPTNLFGVVAMLPGERKTAAFDAALEPVMALEAELRESAHEEIAEKQSARRVKEAQLKKAEADAAKAKGVPFTQEEAKRLARELAKEKVPAEPQLVCSDVTPEKLAQMLGEQDGRMLVASDEGEIFEVAKGRYGKEPNLEVFLKGHSNSPLRSSRVGRGNTEVDRPYLSCALAVQPDVIRGLADCKVMGGRGFLARWLYSYPVSTVGSRVPGSPPVPGSIAHAYKVGMRALWTLEVIHGPDTLHMSREADGLMLEFEQWLEPQLKAGEPLSSLAGWANKLAGHAARIAGILHVADSMDSMLDARRPIGPEIVERAIRLAREYLLPHALVAFGMMHADAKTEDARRVLSWLRRRLNCETVNTVNGVSTVKRRDIHANVFGGRKSAEYVDLVCRLLTDHGYLRPLGDEKRRDSKTYEVNPHFEADDD